MPGTANTESNTNRFAIAVVYLSAFLQGLAMVSFAASGTVLKDGKGFTDAQYGLIFIPQIATTIIGSLAGGALARRVGRSRILLAALIATGLSQIGLAVAVTAIEMPGTFFIVLGSTAMFGLAFGLVASLLIAALMVGVGLGSFVIGPLRQAFTIAELYRFSTLYPLGALLLALGVILARFKFNELKASTCKLVLGHHC